MHPNCANFWLITISWLSARELKPSRPYNSIKGAARRGRTGHCPVVLRAYPPLANVSDLAITYRHVDASSAPLRLYDSRLLDDVF